MMYLIFISWVLDTVTMSVEVSSQIVDQSVDFTHSLQKCSDSKLSSAVFLSLLGVF